MRWILITAVVLVGCPPAVGKAVPDAGSTCAKVGDTCTFSPGKLGSCIWQDDCNGPNGATGCFVCQSQH